jgi:NADPH:quinone reductase-like Zn-dependent oxidoreductase
MKQIWVTHAGSPDVLALRDAPEPIPGPGEVSIAVEAIGVNFADVMSRTGLYPDAPRPPFVPGYEIAGRVKTVGGGVTAYLPGDSVMALTRFGGYSEVVCVPAAQVIPQPPNLTVEQAAGLLVAGFTAEIALVELARVRAGDHVLIQSAAGGVGLMAVDIARLHGATIYGTASASKHDFLCGRGVAHPLDYRDFERAIKRLTNGRGVDVALDSIGGRSWLKSYRALAPLGRLVIHGVGSLLPGSRRSVPALLRFALGVPWLAFNPVALANANRGVMGVNLGRLWDQIALFQAAADRLLAWVKTGDLSVHVDRVFPLADAAEAHRYLQDRRSVGKVILRV